MEKIKSEGRSMHDINGLRCLWWPSMRACVPSITAHRVICFQLHWIAGRLSGTRREEGICGKNWNHRERHKFNYSAHCKGAVVNQRNICLEARAAGRTVVSVSLSLSPSAPAPRAYQYDFIYMWFSRSAHQFIYLAEWTDRVNVHAHRATGASTA